MSHVEKLNQKPDARFSAKVPATHIYFSFNGVRKSGKTVEYDVNTNDETDWLGTVSWFGRWRCYAFNPAPMTVFEKVCLRDIANFCELLTRQHRKLRRQRI